MAKVKRIRLSEKQLKKINRIFLIEEILFGISPIVCYCFLTMKLGDITAIAKQPSVVIVLILSMLSAYIAYLLNLSSKKLLNDSNKVFITINMIILIASQMITINLFALLMLLYLFYVVITNCKINVKEIIKNATFKDYLSQGGGAIIVFIISLICLLITIRLI